MKFSKGSQGLQYGNSSEGKYMKTEANISQISGRKLVQENKIKESKDTRIKYL